MPLQPLSSPLIAPSKDDLIEHPDLVAYWQEEYGQTMAEWYAALPLNSAQDPSMIADALENPAAYVHDDAMERLPELRRTRWINLMHDAEEVIDEAAIQSTDGHDDRGRIDTDVTSFDLLLRLVRADDIQPAKRYLVAELIGQVSREFSLSYVTASSEDPELFATRVHEMGEDERTMLGIAS